MAKEKVLIVNFSSNKITALVAQESDNKTFSVYSEHEVSYMGYFKGNFNDVSEVRQKLIKVINEVRDESNEYFYRIYIGVPSEFCVVKTGVSTLSFDNRKKIKATDVKILMEKEELQNDENLIKIKHNALSYYVENKIVDNPIGIVSNRLMAKISSVYVNNHFYDLVNRALRYIQLKEFEFICTDYACSKYLFDEEELKKGVILINVDFSSTSVLSSKLNGLTGLCSFSLGGGNITKELMDKFKISFEAAQELKSKAVITLDSSVNYIYKAIDKEVEKLFPSSSVNNVILSQIDTFLKLVVKCLSQFSSESFNELPIYFTGNELCNIKGVKTYLEKLLNHKVEIISPQIPQYNNPKYSTILSLMSYCIEEEKNISKNFLKKLIYKIGG